MTGAAVEHRPALRHRLADRGVDPTLLLLVPAALLLLALFVYPFLYGLALSFRPERFLGALGNYQSFFSDSFQWGTIGKTLALALPATLINLAVSVPVAYRLRHRFAGQRLLSTLLVLPVTLWTVFVAEGMLTFLGPRGWFNRALLMLPFVDEPVQLVHNYAGVLLSLVVTGFPFAFLLTLSYLTGIDPSLERAAATLGARPADRFRRVVWPLLLPGLTITFCLAFVLAFSVFPSAVLLGEPAGETRVISYAAWQAAYEQYDYSLASAIAMVMAAVQLVVVGLALGLRGLLYRGPSTGGKG